MTDYDRRGIADHRPIEADFSVLSDSAKKLVRQDKMLKSVAKWENLFRGTNPASRNRMSTQSPTFSSSFSLSHSVLVINNKPDELNRSHSREAAYRDSIRSRRVMLKETPYNEIEAPRKEKQTNPNDSREVHMIFG